MKELEAYREALRKLDAAEAEYEAARRRANELGAAVFFAKGEVSTAHRDLEEALRKELAKE